MSSSNSEEDEYVREYEKNITQTTHEGQSLGKDNHEDQSHEKDNQKDQFHGKDNHEYQSHEKDNHEDQSHDKDNHEDQSHNKDNHEDQSHNKDNHEDQSQGKDNSSSRWSHDEVRREEIRSLDGDEEMERYKRELDFLREYESELMGDGEDPTELLSRLSQLEETIDKEWKTNRFNEKTNGELDPLEDPHLLAELDPEELDILLRAPKHYLSELDLSNLSNLATETEKTHQPPPLPPTRNRRNNGPQSRPTSHPLRGQQGRSSHRPASSPPVSPRVNVNNKDSTDQKNTSSHSNTHKIPNSPASTKTPRSPPIALHLPLNSSSPVPPTSPRLISPRVLIGSPRFDANSSNPPPPSVPLCPSCIKPLKGTVSCALGRKWHKACFKCNLCEKVILLPGEFLSRNDKPYCLDCRDFLTEECTFCKGKIQRSYVRIGEIKLHPECYATLNFKVFSKEK